MHERLSPHKTPACVNLIEALNRCHRDNPFMKFFGVCNTPRSELDVCLGKEVWRAAAPTTVR